MKPSPTPVTWDEKHIKALLSMRRHPLSMIQVEPWQSWLAQRGGIKSVLADLRAAPLSPNQKQLLELILAQPDASTIFYASKLHLGQSAYFARLSELIQSLSIQLNQQQINSSPTPQNNLPAPLTPLIGAEETSATICNILQRPGVRLLTLMGPGGVGKTRLALAAGAQLLEKFRDGIFFIPLETIHDPALLPSQITRSLNIETSGATTLEDALKTYLRERQVLLILDNFEQLIEAGTLVIELLKAAPQLKVLATSREALQQYGEYRFIVPELPRPDPDNPPPLDQLEQWPAVSLFIQRVQALHPMFTLDESNRDSILRICHQLDGLPLAIELAAAQVKLPTLGKTFPTLERALKTMKDASRDRPVRQQTLWDAINWSHQLLPAAEKTLFRQLAVFGREWSLEAAEKICLSEDAQSMLDALANKSLVRYTQTGDELRFQMLQAVREYALEQLKQSGETEMLQRRHASYYLDFARRAEETIGSPQEPIWMERVKQEHENLQIALQWMLDARETEMAFHFLGAIWRFWDMLNIWSETRLWMERALTQGASLRSVARAKTLWGASWLAAHQSDYVQALALAEEGLALARENDEKPLIARLLQNSAEGQFRLHNTQKGISLIEESLQLLRELNDQQEIAWALDHLARGLNQLGERAKSRKLIEESLGIFRAMGHQWAIAASLRHLGLLALLDDDDAQAAEALAESLNISKQLGAKQRISEILRELAHLALKKADLERASELVAEGLSISREIGDRTGEGWALNLQGRVALKQADFPQARQQFEKAQQLFVESREPEAIAFNLECIKRLNEAENKAFSA